jgi:hypothetical protein
MIQVFDSDSCRIGTFKTFDEVLDYFNGQVNLRASDPNSLHGQEKWNFVYYSHRRLAVLHEDRRIKFSEIELEAYTNHLDLIEIYTGDSTPEQIIVTPEIDVTELIKTWCFDYCYAMRYVLLETISGALDTEETENGTSEYRLFTVFI